MTVASMLETLSSATAPRRLDMSFHILWPPISLQFPRLICTCAISLGASISDSLSEDMKAKCGISQGVKIL
eukprot:scaffold201143_cov34-Tisochrysis_lutea.AAC.4